MGFNDFHFYNLLLAFVWSFVVAVFAIPPIIQLAHKKALYDKPGKRTYHSELTPRLGGLAIFAGLSSAITVFGDFSGQMSGLQFVLAGCILVFFVGLKDDVEPVSAFKKFFVQLFAASIVIVLGGVKITTFHGVFGIYDLPPESSVLFSFLVIVGLTNAINLIDGLDGLAGVLVLIMATSFGVHFYIVGSPFGVLAFSLAGAVLGFLRYNLWRAQIFMGDTGSLVCGFLIAIMAVELSELQSIEKSSALAFSIVIVPIVDTIRVFTIRILNGQSPFTPDKNHVHHILIRKGLKPIQVVFVLGLFNLTCILVVDVISNLSDTILVAGIIALVVASILGFEILSHYERKSRV